MSEIQPGPGPSREQLMIAVGEARSAVVGIGPEMYDLERQRGGTRTEIMGGIVEGPRLRVNEGSLGSRVDATVTVPTEQGQAEYRAHDFADRKGNTHSDHAKTEITRYDKEGNEVYRFVSRRPELARQVGVVAARRIGDIADTKSISE